MSKRKKGNKTQMQAPNGETMGLGGTTNLEEKGGQRLGHALARGGYHRWEVMRMEAHERLVVSGVSV